MPLPTGMWAAIAELFSLVVEGVRRWWAKSDEHGKRLKEAENELKEAVLSGNVDRVTRARHELDRLQK